MLAAQVMLYRTANATENSHIYKVILTEGFAQIGASMYIEERVKLEITLVQIPKMLKKYLKLKHRVKIQ